jgi:hypothetical protein
VHLSGKEFMNSISDLKRKQMPNEVRERHFESVNHEGNDIMHVFEEFKQVIHPYGSGNIHPGFMGWVQGGETILNPPSLSQLIRWQSCCIDGGCASEWNEHELWRKGPCRCRIGDANHSLGQRVVSIPSRGSWSLCHW